MEKLKLVYAFEEGDGRNKQLLGGKGAGLWEMTQIGLPVPPGFVITTEACRQFCVWTKSVNMELSPRRLRSPLTLWEIRLKGHGKPQR